MSQKMIRKLRAKGWTVNQEGKRFALTWWLHALRVALGRKVRLAEGHS